MLRTYNERKLQTRHDKIVATYNQFAEEGVKKTAVYEKVASICKVSPDTVGRVVRQNQGGV